MKSSERGRLIALAVLNGLLFILVSLYVDFPYMDEIFHVRQTLKYVNEHDFLAWDPKITTPPGLYILGFLVSKLLGAKLVVLRLVNLIPILAWLIYPSWRLRSAAILTCTFPLLAFYGNLYYTDVWATLFVIFGSKLDSSWESAAVLFTSLWFRQTNIIWAGFAAATRILPPGIHVTYVFKQTKEIFKRLWKFGFSYLLVAILFGVYLHWNQGIVLGDKSNHEFSLHFAQLLYFGLFFLLFSGPQLLQFLFSQNKTRLQRVFGNLKFVPIELVVICAIIKYGTVVHPFILSDNRHYTFYIWRRLIVPFHGYQLIPVYWVAWRWFRASVDFRLLLTWVYVLATAAVLVPSPLMEPRYYILPYLIWRIQIFAKPPSNLEIAWNVFINVGVVCVFCFSETHFMW